MVAKTAGDGSKAYPQGQGTRPFQGNMTVEPNLPATPNFVKSSDKNIETMPVPVTGKHPSIGG